MRKVLLGFVALVLVLGSSAPSFADDDPAPGSPAWEERDRDNMAYSTARKQDEFSNVAAGRETFWGTLESYPQNLLDQLQHPDRPVVSFGQFIPGGSMIDPYRQRWDRGPAPRGIRWRTEYLNRYGSRIIANVWAPLPGTPNPVTGSPMHAPYPGIVITTGSIQAPQELYMWAAQGLAEAGYVVMTFDVQGQGRSELLPHPVEVFCDPNGAWRSPQEGGTTETGPCAGVPSQQGANFVLGTYDALNWFLSDANPARGMIDAGRIGLAGHSLGASAVTNVGNADPRVSTVVAWDNANLPAGIPPRVPTMGQNADYFFNPQPMSDYPDPKNGTFARFRTAGVPSMQVALRGSTHLEWAYVPVLLAASRKGERVAMYYTLAWFDRWLKGDVSADARLTAGVFDSSSDSSSIGTGYYDAENDANVPYTIGGECVSDHLSFYYDSSYAFGPHHLDDMRHGLSASCPA